MRQLRTFRKIGNPFRVIVINSGPHLLRLSGPSERAVADAAETALRHLDGGTLGVAVQIECRDSAAGRRIAAYLVDVAAELALIASEECQQD
ncbi:hypothetical protein MOX02_03510 [Methylobacterium oxalidis]|uniref:Uncharacterized protein n=1 Tax=Methylobacterium oxalidis TaxID=944322 RepID=A0A512IXD0_9HYPH|nr:hypothetical protein MOX02_03510 [Methylobacterium oxalidis]GLS67692.1 hypothetical protein GCM10007888_60770 [Methylobacterium oxalidis]